MQAIRQVRRYHRALSGIVLALLIAGLLSIHLATAVSADVAVNIMNFSFQPTTLTIPVGTTVVWTNRDSTSHTVTSDTGVWDSGILMTGKTFSFTFAQAGTFAYHCNIHPNMHGTIVVTAAGGAAATAPSATMAPAPTSPPAPSAVATSVPMPTAMPLPVAPPRTGGGGEASFIRRLGDG